MDSVYQVILAEDHVRLRAEVKKIVNGIRGVEVIGEAGEGCELFELLAKTQPDLLFLDISMPNLKAMKATPEIKSRYPQVKIIIMVMDQEAEYLSQAIAVGSDGVLLKQNCAMHLELAIKQIRLGKQYFPRRWEGKSFGASTIPLRIFDSLTFLPMC
jgi:DNA-binding NarL/FixJ family response regulator